MSVNILPFSLDRALSVEGSRICGPGPYQHLPDQPGSVFVCRFVTYGSSIFQSIFSSQITGNGVLISYRTSDVNGIRLD